MSKRLKPNWGPTPPGYDPDKLWEETAELRQRHADACRTAAQDAFDEWIMKRIQLAKEHLDNVIARMNSSKLCIGEYVDFQGCARPCIEGGEGCAKPGCHASEGPSGGW